MTLHTSWTVSDVVAAEAHLLESIHYEVETYSPPTGSIFSPRACLLKAEQLQQRTTPAVRSPLSLTVVPVEVVRSGALLVAAGFARVCSAWFVTCLLWVCLLHAGVRWR